MAVTASTVLVLRALGLGDMLTGIPALRGLRRAHPRARIVLAAPVALRPLAMLCGAVDEVTPTTGLGVLRWTDGPPALAVNLHGRGPQSITDLLTCQPERLVSHRHPAHADVPGPPWRPEQHEVDRWCALLQWAGIDADPADLSLVRPAGPPDRSDVVVIHPGASAQARRWPAERFAAVAAALRDEDGCHVVITGSASEAELGRSIAQLAGLDDEAVLAGRLGLLELVALISDCRLLICGDTGVGHLATATGTPSVLLFGPTPPQLWGPRGSGPHIAVWAGDRGDPHADRTHSGLLLITVSRVLDASRNVLERCA
jgi:ADP-heptose:LPS heptosyltransferase